MSGGCGLLHHLAELAGDRQSSLARVCRRLDEEDVASDRSDGQPGCDSGIGGAPAHLAGEPARPEPLANALLVDADLRLLALGDLAGRLAAEIGDPPLEVAHAGLAGVLARDELQGFVR